MLRPIFIVIVGIFIALLGCNGKTRSTANGQAPSAANAESAQPKEIEPPKVQPTINNGGQLSPFVRRIFQDRSGNLWFGTNGDGVIRYDGKALKYFSINEGFGGVAVRGIVQDKEGNVWFGTEGGLTKYDGESFTNFTEKEGLVNNDVWSIVIDNKGVIWIGTLQGVSCFDGKVFTPFAIPDSAPDPARGVTAQDRPYHHGRQPRPDVVWQQWRCLSVQSKNPDKYFRKRWPVQQCGKLHFGR